MKRIRADQRVGLLLAGVVLLGVLAFGATVALPATDSSLDAEPTEFTAEQHRGMEVFRGEGCWYCHTQYVRETSTDAALGEPLGPSGYAGSSPALLGAERMGPDLTRITTTAEAIEQHGSAGSLAYLSEAEIAALAAYLSADE